MPDFTIEETALGRIVVAPAVPRGFALFYTTIDFPGRITGEISAQLADFISQRFGIEASLTTCFQVHSSIVRRTQHESQWRECASCDALWTSDRQVALGIKVADCLPVSMLDPLHSVIANVHSGWRGTVQNITAETVDAMERSSAFSAAGALAYLGPSIRACCFEVGEEVVERFAAEFDDFEQYVDRSRSKPHVDLPAFTRGVLRNRGFADANIFDSKICTRCDGSIFHSYRRTGRDGGRNLAFAVQ